MRKCKFESVVGLWVALAHVRINISKAGSSFHWIQQNDWSYGGVKSSVFQSQPHRLLLIHSFMT
jgi:hypothetical protein